MKARVIATGKIVDVYESCNEDFPWTDKTGDKVWKTEELIFLEDTENNPDYWTRLEHQYAGMAMQGLMSMPVYGSNGSEIDQDAVIECAMEYAHALVEKYKREE